MVFAPTKVIGGDVAAEKELQKQNCLTPLLLWKPEEISAQCTKFFSGAQIHFFEKVPCYEMKYRNHDGVTIGVN